MVRRRLWAGGAALVALALMAAACGDSSAKSTTASSGTNTTATSRAATSGSTGAPGTTAASIGAYDGEEKGQATTYPEPSGCGTVGLQLPTAAAERSVVEKGAFEKQVAKLGGKAIVFDDQVDPGKQVANLQQLQSQGVKAIGVYPLDPNSLGPVLRQAADAGVAVIVEDVTHGGKAPDLVFTSEIGESRDRAAYEQMKWIAQQQPNAKVGIIGLTVPVPGLVYFRGRQQYWGEKFGLQIVGTELQGTDDAAGGQTTMNALLTKNPDLNAAVAYNDRLMVAAAAAARLADRKVLTVGFDGDAEGIQSVKAGGLTATFQQSPVATGIAFANGLCALSNDPKATLPKIIQTELAGPITKDTVGQYSTWSELLAKTKF